MARALGAPMPARVNVTSYQWIEEITLLLNRFGSILRKPGKPIRKIDLLPVISSR